MKRIWREFNKVDKRLESFYYGRGEFSVDTYIRFKKHIKKLWEKKQQGEGVYKSPTFV